MTKEPTIIVKNHFYRGAVKKGQKANRAPKAVASKLSGHFKYLEHRPGEQDRAIFDAERDQVTRREAINDVMEHRSNRVDYHLLILSPDPEEPVSDLRQWTRDIMEDYAQQQGKDVHWYAVEHHNTVEHPHVHVVIAGGATAPDQEKLQPVVIFEDERDLLHRSALEHSDHDMYRLMDEENEREARELHEERPARMQEPEMDPLDLYDFDR